MSFEKLPTELKLTLLSHTHTLEPFCISREVTHLTHYIQAKKLEYHLNQKPLLVSIYSSFGRDAHKKVFYETCVSSTSKSMTKITLGQMHHKESLLQSAPNFKDTYRNETHLDLLMPEEQTSCRVFISLVDSTTMKPVLQHTTSIFEGESNVEMAHGMEMKVRLEKGLLEPPKDGVYEWNDSYNYGLHVDGFSIKTGEFIELFENDNDGRLIVRY